MPITNQKTLSDILDKVCRYLDVKNIPVTKDELSKLFNEPKKKIKFKKKPKVEVTEPSKVEVTEPSKVEVTEPSKVEVTEPSKVINNKKFKIKKQKKSKDEYKAFVDICTKHELSFFQFNDENNWQGPATKIDDNDTSNLIDNFKSIKLFTIKGTGFIIIRPFNHYHDSNIVYPTYTENCKVFSESMIPSYSEDEDQQNVLEFGQEIVAEDWWYDGTKYLLDANGNVFSCETHDYIGRKIDDFTIDNSLPEI